MDIVIMTLTTKSVGGMVATVLSQNILTAIQITRIILVMAIVMQDWRNIMEKIILNITQLSVAGTEVTACKAPCIPQSHCPNCPVSMVLQFQ
mmetsp:Transcript_10328/g.22374  ORF Transcript_10328/g.22374 Transcript_10328/m.22374 type:complete len:92 (-) Transcript_10328:93-368(-)